MAPWPSHSHFIDTALYCTSHFSLSYTDPDQKWLIRKHLLSLLQDYPNFSPSTGTFTHNDGTTVTLLKATGSLQVSQSTPTIGLVIWLHENYPYLPPVVLVSSDAGSPIHRDHPFVDLSGATTCTYLQTWVHPRCNLSGLVRNLVKIFSHDHPFACSPLSSFTHPSLVSKMEALDRLAGMISYDLVALRAKTEDEIEEISKLQWEMVKRVEFSNKIVTDFEEEREKLRERVRTLTEEADVLVNWVRVHEPCSVLAMAGDDIADAFEAVDDESRLVIDCLANDNAIEDLIYALDKAVEEGVVRFDVYIKQVRALAREQFAHRDTLVKVHGSEF